MHIPTEYLTDELSLHKDVFIVGKMTVPHKNAQLCAYISSRPSILLSIQQLEIDMAIEKPLSSDLTSEYHWRDQQFRLQTRLDSLRCSLQYFDNNVEDITQTILPRLQVAQRLYHIQRKHLHLIQDMGLLLPTQQQQQPRQPDLIRLQQTLMVELLQTTLTQHLSKRLHLLYWVVHTRICVENDDSCRCKTRRGWLPTTPCQCIRRIHAKLLDPRTKLDCHTLETQRLYEQLQLSRQLLSSPSCSFSLTSTESSTNSNSPSSSSSSSSTESSSFNSTSSFSSSSSNISTSSRQLSPDPELVAHIHHPCTRRQDHEPTERDGALPLPELADRPVSCDSVMASRVKMSDPIATRVIRSLAPPLPPPLPDPPLSLGTFKVRNRTRRQRRSRRQRCTCKTVVLQHHSPTCVVDARILIITELFPLLPPPEPPPPLVCAEVDPRTRVNKELFPLLPPPEPPPPLVCAEVDPRTRVVKELESPLPPPEPDPPPAAAC